MKFLILIFFSKRVIKMTTKNTKAFYKCAVCKTMNLCPSTNYTFTRRTYLDGRPIHSSLQQMQLWSQQCRNCGYCASSINELMPYAEESVYTDTFQALRKLDKFPSLANKFICHAFIFENAGAYSEASRKYLEAAWVCDDLREDYLANECRTKSIELLIHSREGNYASSTSPLRDDGGIELVLSDMLRRTGRFSEAHNFALKGLEARGPNSVKDMLRLELDLISAGDTSAARVTSQPSRVVIGQLNSKDQRWGNAVIWWPIFDATLKFAGDIRDNWRRILGVIFFSGFIFFLLPIVFMPSIYLFSLELDLIGWITAAFAFFHLLNFSKKAGQHFGWRD